MYEVVIDFEDRRDKLHTYSIGESYPRKGYKPKQDRVEELISKGYIQDPVIEGDGDE